MENRNTLIREYLSKVKAASKEARKKEAFKDLLNRLYTDTETLKVIDAITMGAEKTIVNIPRKDRLHAGSADTLYNNIIIEFEKDLKTSLKHAKEQLAGYLLGEFKTSKEYNYILIASDLINWKVFAPKVEQLDKLETLHEDELELEEIISASFSLNENNADDFYFWIDRFLFKEEKQKATLKRIEEAFGYQSKVFAESYRELSAWFGEAKKYGEVQVSFEQWRKFLSIAYGKFDATESNFLIHTYLSVFSKMLAYSIVSNKDFITDNELKGILDGDIFNQYQIRNFIDNDFFHWVKSDVNFRNLKKSFRLLAQEISTFDFNSVEEDVLKGVYQELIDLDTRHALGEYYTPDWLCERIVNEFEFKENSTILDPACGSGSFLRAAIHRMKQLHPAITVDELSSQIYGIDIHPLSVQIAKTTLLLALGKEVRNLKRPIHLNIILSNTLKIPEGVSTLFGADFKMDIDKENFRLNTKVLDDLVLFDEGVDVCEDLAEQTMNKKSVTRSTLENTLKQQSKRGGITPQIVDSFYMIYEGLKKVKEKGRDSIWKFILQNLYKPYFLGSKFDFIIGNPPWFTYSSIKNEEYQDTLNELAEKYKIKPAKVANFPHLEIAAIFLAHCTNYFLKEKGKLAFVLPRSFFSADHHDNTRSGDAKGFRITNIWDLKDVSPLFRIPSCTLFAEKAHVLKKISKEGAPGIQFNANLPAHNCNYSIATPKLTEKPVTWFYVKQGKSSAFSATLSKSSIKVNPYKKLFKQGATIVPRSFYFIELMQEIDDFEDRLLNIKTAEAIKADSKLPWKDLGWSGQIESRFVFRTAIGRGILPFALHNPDLVVLPLIIEEKNNVKQIKLHTAKDLQTMGYSNASKWFAHAERIWNIHRTEKSKNMSCYDRLDFQKGLTEQNINEPYLLIYSGRGTDACATVVVRKELDLEMFIDHANYLIGFGDFNEAHYVCSILNSSSPNELMKDFQSTGLFGARNIHKKILDVYFPKFYENSKVHNQLAQLSENAHLKVKDYLVAHPPAESVTGMVLGKLRVEIKKFLKEEMERIDELVKEVMG